MSQALIVGIDSELGGNIGNHLHNLGWAVFGTTRRKEFVSNSRFYLDARDVESISAAIDSFLDVAQDWELLIIAIGTLNPIGKITEIDFSRWRDSFDINFLNQILLIKILLERTNTLPRMNRKVLTFAGSGTNSAPQNFSAYTLSKIALIKATELLAAENPDCTFLSLGTGWMNSPIHQQTLDAGMNAGGNAYVETKRRLENQEFGDPAQLLDFIDWYVRCQIGEISGRNVALQGDAWNDQDFVKTLIRTDDAFKLRRSK